MKTGFVNDLGFSQHSHPESPESAVRLEKLIEFLYKSEVIESLEKIKIDLEKRISNPRDIKRQLARELVTIYHDSDAAISAEKEFDAMFIDKDEPDDMPEYHLLQPEKLLFVMTENKMVDSNGEARRMIAQGGVRINKEKVEDIHITLEAGEEIVIKVGKRKFLRVTK